MLQASVKPNQLTSAQLDEVNEFRQCGFGLGAIASAFGLSEFELKVEISAAERTRQLTALTLSQQPGSEFERA